MLYTSINIAGIMIKNRLVRSATHEGKYSPDGKATQGLLDIYRDLAIGGVGLIITGLLAVSSEGKGFPEQGEALSDDNIVEIAKVADTVHRTQPDCKVFAQLCHSGRQVLHSNSFVECLGPSDVQSPILVKQVRELSKSEIQKIIVQFADAIERVKKAGFDGVQLHAAHGYLLSSFVSPYTNRRTDEYGEGFAGKAKIIREIIEIARMKVGNFPITIKINCDDFMVDGIHKSSFPEFLGHIEECGVDAIEISGAMWDCLSRSEEELGFPCVPIPESRVKIDQPEKQSYFYSYIKGIRCKVPIILVGGNRNKDSINQILNEGFVDLCAMSRPLICEPDLPKRWQEGRGNLTGCVSCNGCLATQTKPVFGCALKKFGFKREQVEAFIQNSWRDIFR